MADKMQILFVSVLSSERLVNKIYETTGLNPGFAVQKFSRLLAKGFTASGAKVTALTNPPITRHNCKKVLVTFGKETEQDIQYKYIPFINFNFLKHLCVFLYSFFYVLFWGLRKKNEKFIVCDVLCVSACMGSLLASKLNHVKSVGIVTDLPAFAFISDDMNGRLSFVRKINSSYISKFNSYVLLTEQMDSVVNTKSKPYIVMEGLVDSSISSNAPQKLHDENKKIFLYAGGLYKIFGLDKLVDAFRSIERDDIQLSLYGSGSYVEELKQIALIDKRVVYHGVQTNDVVVEAEKEATVLVNPRPTEEKFTKYSFPSKNMEYMVSGTPVLTTKLPGMPQDYYPYIFTIDDESIEGYREALLKILDCTSEELTNKGICAKKFVLEKKNNVVQASKVIKLMKSLDQLSPKSRT